jgi:tRNA-dihydrouridine synthase 3
VFGFTRCLFSPSLSRRCSTSARFSVTSSPTTPPRQTFSSHFDSYLRFIIRLDQNPSSLPDDDQSEGAKFATPGGTMSSRDNYKKDARDNYKQNRARNKENRGHSSKNRFHAPFDNKPLCGTRTLSPEFGAEECAFGEKCKFEHDLRKYLHDKHADLKTFGGTCPVFNLHGFCPAGWKCRFVGSHSEEIVREDLDGKKELRLVIDHKRFKEDKYATKEDMGLYNSVDKSTKFELSRRKITLDKSDAYNQWLQDVWQAEEDARGKATAQHEEVSSVSDTVEANEDAQETANVSSEIGDVSKAVDEPGSNITGKELEFAKEKGADPDERTADTVINTEGDDDATSEKYARVRVEEDVLVKARHAPVKTGDAVDEHNDAIKHEPQVDPKTPANDYGDALKEEAIDDKDTKQETHVDKASKMDREDERAAYIEPPFRASEKRRLYYGPETPILAPLTTQGNLPFRRLCVQLGAQLTFSEMALGLPIVQGANPEWALMKAHESEITPPKVSDNASDVVPGYDNSNDVKFGVQIAAGKPWIAYKTTEVIAKFCPHVRAIDLNSGCPIDLVCKLGAGSSLMDQPSKLEKILRGMNAVSGEIPITLKIRTGTRDKAPTADSVVKRVLFGGRNAQDAGLGPTGIAAITLHGRSRQQRYTRLADWEYIADIAALIRKINKTNAEKTDTAAEPDPRDLANGGKVLFVGNGDILSHEEYQTHIERDLVDCAMVGRGALIKPWIFEEIAAGQYLDKSATERLGYVEDFVRYGLDTWGADERGVQTTRRFLLEWLSFAHRYVPVGLLEHLPPKINERPPPFRGRDDMETMLASDHYGDWIRISEMYLGRAERNFRFEPKHKSNSYEMQAEG